MYNTSTAYYRKKGAAGNRTHPVKNEHDTDAAMNTMRPNRGEVLGTNFETALPGMAFVTYFQARVHLVGRFIPVASRLPSRVRLKLDSSPEHTVADCWQLF